MKTELENIRPEDIERRSFEIIESELTRPIDPGIAPIVKRVIHTTADFEYADSLCFSKNAVAAALLALKEGACIVTDTNMAKAGINSRALEQLDCRKVCFMADEDIAQAAKRKGTTRAAASVEKAARLSGQLIFAIGNAPTALVRVCELIKSGELSPALVIGVPVGFVNVVQAKELIMQTETPYIVARGRKGGSNVAAAIVNALLYMLTRNTGGQAQTGKGMIEMGKRKNTEKKARFFSHAACEYFPCHPTDEPEAFNCLFCYCPLYTLGEDCGGDFSYNSKGVKDCRGCLRPHRKDFYDEVTKRFPEIAALARKK